MLDTVKAMTGDLNNALSNGSARIQLEAYGGKQGDKSSDARRLSLKRALIVRQLLIDDGIPSERIDVRAMGGASDGAPRPRRHLRAGVVIPPPFTGEGDRRRRWRGRPHARCVQARAHYFRFRATTFSRRMLGRAGTSALIAHAPNPGSITLAPRRVHVHQCCGVSPGARCDTVQLPATFMSMSRASVPRLANSAMASAAAIATPASA